MIFGEVKAPGCEDCVVEGQRAYCTMNCSPRESVERPRMGEGSLNLGHKPSECPDIVKNIVDDLATLERVDCPFGWYRILSAGFALNHAEELVFNFSYEVVE